MIKKIKIYLIQNFRKIAVLKNKIKIIIQYKNYKLIKIIKIWKHKKTRIIKIKRHKKKKIKNY